MEWPGSGGDVEALVKKGWLKGMTQHLTNKATEVWDMGRFVFQFHLIRRGLWPQGV